MDLITLFARKEPTVDPVSIAHGLAHKQDTVLYQDRECTRRYAIWNWAYSNCPRRKQRTVMLNCYRWKLEWIAQPT